VSALVIELYECVSTKLCVIVCNDSCNVERTVDALVNEIGCVVFV
jgi:hypothetical protein